ncbi:MAG: PAS domain S-box protein [Opitutaceae bacterium]|nr:PAS domain S-box protein [Opitutaceae bacterium]
MTFGFNDRVRRSPLAAYGVSVAIAVVMLLLRLAVASWLGERLALVLGVVPIVLVAYLGGFGPGVLATGMIALGTYGIAASRHGVLPIDSPGELYQWIAFLVSGVVISVTFESLHRARQRAQESAELRHRALELREQLAAIVDSSEDAIVGKNLTGIITSWNRGAEKIFGYRAEEAVGQSIRMLFPPDRVSEEDEISARLRRGEVVTHFQTERVCKDGRRIEVSVTISPMRNALGQVVGASKIARDITAFREIERQLRFHESVLRETGMIAKVGGWHLDPRIGEAYWTGEVARIHDLPPETSISKAAALSYYHGESRVKIEAAVNAAIEQGRPYDLELEIVTAKGVRKWVRTIGHPVVEAGRVTLVRGSIQDVTERKKMELALREAQALYRSLVDQMPAGVFRKDAAGRFVLVNAMFCRMSGFTPEHYLGRTINEIKADLSQRMEKGPTVQRAIDLSAEASPHHEYIMRTGETVKAEEEWILPEGGRRLLLAEKTPVYDSVGSVIGSQGVIFDITQQKQIEQALRESEERFSTAFRASPAAVALSRRDNRRILEVNDSFLQLFDCTREEIVGNTLIGAGLVDPAAVDTIRLQLNATQEVRNLELPVKTRRGEPRFINLSVRVISIGGETCALSILFDITDRKRMEEALRESEALLRTVTETAEVGMVIVTEEHRYRYANRAYAKILRLPTHDIVGQRVADVLSSVYTTQIRPRLDRAFHGERVSYELAMPETNPGAAPQQLAVTYEPGQDAHGRVVVVVIVDITERKRVEESLRQSEERFRQVVENIHEVFWMTDLEKHQVLYISPGYEKVWGASCEGLYASPESWSAAIHRDDRERVLLAAQTKQASGEYDETYRIARPDGELRWIRDQAFPIADPDGVVRRVVGVAEDITESKTLQSQFLRAQRLEAIGTLSSGIAHDLNNILAPMLMIGPVLKEKLKDPLDHELVDLVETGAKRGANIIRQLLAFSRGIDGERTLVQPRHLIREMIAIMRETFPRGITISDSVPSHLWSVMADATQLHQVLLNLCVNARDAMPNGGRLSITAQNARVEAGDQATHLKPKPGPHVLLSVSDTGMGIPQHVLDRMFEPFFTTKEIGKGTGLGLSTVLGVVKSHGGFITVYSEVNRGSVFKIYLPADASSVEGALRERPRLPKGDQQLILIVDDEASIRTSLRRTLEGHNYRVLSAADGREAISLLRAQPEAVKLLLTDLMMPGMNGVALIREIRRLAPHVKVIAASGLHDPDRGEELAALSVAEILAKPCESGEILEAVERGLRENPQPS